MQFDEEVLSFRSWTEVRLVRFTYIGEYLPR